MAHPDRRAGGPGPTGLAGHGNVSAGDEQHRLARRIGELRRRLWASNPAGARRAGPDTTDAFTAWAAVDALPLRQRTAIYLHYRLDLPYEDVGRVMGISAGAARVSASRGLGAVRAALNVEDEGGDA